MDRRIVALTLLVLPAIAGCASTGADSAAPRQPAAFDVPHARDIVIDGRDDDWPAQSMLVRQLAAYPPQRTTQDFDAVFALAWDDRGLLVRATVQDQEMHEVDSGLWQGDGIIIHVGGTDSPWWYEVIIAPGLDGKHNELRWTQAKLGRAIPWDRSITVQAASLRTGGGYVIEARLPWMNLDQMPGAGERLSVQLSAVDADSGAATAYARWHPGPSAYRDAEHRNVIRLAEAASPPSDIAASYELEDCQYARIEALAPAAATGGDLLVGSGGAPLATARFADSSGRARAEVTIPLPPPGQPFEALRLESPAGAMTLALPDARQARLEAYRSAKILFEPFVFTGSVLPQPRFEHPGLVRDLVGSYTLTVRYFDADYAEVTSAQRPGRYGAIVEVRGADDLVDRRFYTLYRRSTEANLDDDDVRFALTLPAELGLDPAVLSEQAPNINDFQRREASEGMRSDPDCAVLFAGLAETPRGEIASRRTSASRRDERWWYGLKRQSGDLAPLKRWVYTPAGYDADPAARWPLFVMLHGNFPRTPDSTIPTSGNESQLANIQRLKLPFVVLTPLCPPDQYWSNDALVECIAQVQAKYRIDADRIYLCGCSMGGYGAFALAGERPDVFAAMIAGCGGGDPRDAARFKGLPVRVLHGAKDEVVPLRSSQEMVDALKAAGCPVEFVVLPEAGHDIGTESFADPALYQWLLSHRRSDRAAASTQPAAPPQ